ncbi:MAG TPA: hypothetical protein VLT58_03550, partial [Polyangia bacterium]|nr:hypothetical protein [Polyangia bacterium]
MRRRLLSAVWGLAGLCTMTSCSFLFVHGPPPDHDRLQYFDCSSSNVLPVLDALYGGLAAVEAAAAAAAAAIAVAVAAGIASALRVPSLL